MPQLLMHHCAANADYIHIYNNILFVALSWIFTKSRNVITTLSNKNVMALLNITFNDKIYLLVHEESFATLS